MKKVLLLTALLLSFHAVCGQRMTDRPHPIDTLKVVGRRMMADIGNQRTVLDTSALRENVTNSLADVLSQNTSIFIKSYGRASLSTASFRGTAPSHTQVTWNGMKLNSPMLGMVDFSMIPSYFIDDAVLYHGASSVGLTGGGLGGAIALATAPEEQNGWGIRYIQGIGSYRTFDEFLRVTYGRGRVQATTRAMYSTSDNDFRYTNYRKKIFVYDEDRNIVDGYFPKERNKNGDFRDVHLMQEVFARLDNGDRIELSAWYLRSQRGVPMLNVDYRQEDQSRNRQDEKTLRTVLRWRHDRRDYRISASAGYTYTDLQYLYLADIGKETLSTMIHSKSYVHTGYLKAQGEYFLGDRWMFSVELGAHQHLVNSADRSILSTSGNKVVVGYDKGRSELTGLLSAKFRPGSRWGFAVNLRGDRYGDEFTPVIPALFAEYTPGGKGYVKIKASGARNYRYPTINDLYFMPGGNDTLKTEKGYTYDFGIEARRTVRKAGFELSGAFYDAYITDWIVWLPTFKGFWSPLNVKKVHSYGVELKGKFDYQSGGGWRLRLDGNYTITRSINHGDPVNWADQAIGKQLVNIPKYSAALTGRADRRSWSLLYKWNHYSQRFTTSSNETATKIGILKPYYMSDVSLEKRFGFRRVAVACKFSVNNLFGEEYESVLSRPMAGRNYGLYIQLTPKLNKS